MACGSCGGKSVPSNKAYQVTLGGVVVSSGGPENDGQFATSAEARIWIGQNANGQAATVRVVAKR